MLPRLFLFCAVALAARAAEVEPVGFTPGDSNRVVLPVSQIITPAGRQVELPKLRPQALALSPDGKLLLTSGKSAELIVIDPATGEIKQRVPLPSDQQTDEPPDVVSPNILQPDKSGQLSFTGLIFSRDGRRAYLANVNGSVKVFAVAENGVVSGLFSIPLPPTQTLRPKEIPAGLALSADGRRLYICGNLSNRLLECDATTGDLLRSWETGIAPFDVALTADGKKAYVSNWGGRRPDGSGPTGPAGRGVETRVDPRTHVASEGSVSVIELAANRVKAELITGRHASALALTPDGRHLAVANAAEDTVSILDTRADKIIETVSLKWQPRDYFGASPNALTFDARGKKLFVCNGTHNAVAVLDFSPRRTKLRGLIPTGWYPGAVICDDARRQLCVANIKGFGSGRRLVADSTNHWNSHQYFGSVSLIPQPATRAELARHTRQVLHNCRREQLEAAQLPARPGQPPRPLPERTGEPSLIKHVVYVIKENRTYDQVLGDLPEGRGEPKLCIFGERVTPNQHKLAREFVLLDNTYCSGILSADGHQWSTSGFVTDYLERSFAGFPRSYPDVMDDDEQDALAYSPAGFIWDNALEHGQTVRNFGEFCLPFCGWHDATKKGEPKWSDYYADFINGTELTYARSRPGIESLRPHTKLDTVGWNMSVPDVYRAAKFIQELREWERRGEMPNLVIICLPNDHTSGASAGLPTPEASVADNDLAFGQIVEALSHSRFWRESCVLAIEDDPQNGWDHVSAFRTTAYCASPYTKRGAVVSAQYSQPGLLRTIELMLGLPPMNALVASAQPMADCFTLTPDFTPFRAVTNNIPLDQLNPAKKTAATPRARRLAEISEKLPLDRIDACDEDTLNRILWEAVRGDEPFPKWAQLPKHLRRERD